MKKLNCGITALGVSIFLGLSSLGYLVGNSIVETKKLERVVNVKGLSEREVKADTVIWPIEFRVTGNDLQEIYNLLEENNSKISSFLMENGIEAKEISVSQPNIEDRSLYESEMNKSTYRYIGTETVTVYSNKVDEVTLLTEKIGELLKEGVSLAGSRYDNTMQYDFTKLNELKPEMIEEATRNAREVAEKFAKDSNSSLGKIKSANQGQFSIMNRDQYNPQIKKVRVVSTVEYYLVD